MTAAGANAGRARVFFALWPDASVRTALAALAQEAQAECGGRAMAAENVHVTLFFVGPVERARLAALERAAQRPRGRSFSLTLDRVGYWRHNRIVWAGATEFPAALATLAEDLRVALAREGVQGEERPYVPHVTLVRNAERKPGAPVIEPCVWSVDEFVLVESVSVPGGVRYQPLTRFALSR